MPCGCLQTDLQKLKRRFNVDVRVFHDVIERQGRQEPAGTQPADRRRAARSLRRAVAEPGAAPIRLPPGIESQGYTPRGAPTWIASWRRWRTDKPRHVTVVGGGFIGLEMMEALHQRKLVTLLELSSR